MRRLQKAISSGWICFKIQEGCADMISTQPSCILISVSLSDCLSSSCKISVTNANLYQSLHYLKAHIQDKADIFFHAAELVEVSLMSSFDIIDQRGEICEADGRFQICMCFSLLYTVLQSVLKYFFVMIMLAETSCICFVMRKSKIIRHIVDHFAEPSPVNSLVTLIRSDICQFFHPVLDIFKCSVELVSSGDKGRFDIRQNAAQTESLSVRLQACCGLHLIRKVSC